MGLTTWKGNKVRKKDVTIAKNYLTEEEMKSLNRIVTMYLDYAEERAERRQPMTMKEWSERLDAFLQFNEREILKNAGSISAEVAKQLAKDTYEKFHKLRLQTETKRSNEALDSLAQSLENKDKQ